MAHKKLWLVRVFLVLVQLQAIEVYKTLGQQLEHLDLEPNLELTFYLAAVDK